MADSAPGSAAGGGLGDILSMALLQTGVDSVTSTQISMDSNSILNAAANTLDSSLLSTDIGVLTDGLFSTLGLVKENPLSNKPRRTIDTSTGATPIPQSSSTTNAVSSSNNQVTAPLINATQASSVAVSLTPTSAATTAGSVMAGLEVPAQVPLTVIAPPSESEVKAAQLLKAELQNSCLEDDIDLDELLSGGDAVNADSVGDISFLDSGVGTAPPSLQTHSSIPFPPPTCLSSLTSSTNTTSSGGGLSSLLDVTGSQHLEGVRSPSAEGVCSLSVGTCTNSKQSLASTVVATANSVSDTAPSAKVHVLAVASVSTSSSPSSSSPSSTKATTTTAPLPPPLTTSITPAPIPASSTAPSTRITKLTKSTSTSTSPQLKKPTLTTTKLDIAAILREVTKMSPASIAASTSPLTNTVSVTVVPSSAIQNVMKRTGALKTQKIGSLSEGVPLVARAPLVLQRGGNQAVVKEKQQEQSIEEDSEDEDDDWSAINTYANYKPAKLRIGHSHPDPIVESSSLSSVEPPQVWFDLKLPPHVIEQVQLSSLQLEAVVYACQQHMNILSDGSRAGFLIGDGAGVGKGRTMAGIIYQNYLEGRKKAVWFSVSNDLKYDAMRDLRDVGAKKIDVYSIKEFHYGKISGKRNGRVRKGVIFSTYSSLIGESSSGGKYRTRFNQLLHWLGPQFEGVIVFDECHRAKNLVPTGASKPSKTGLTVLQLQKKLPKARIMYCSATGASEPRNMAYMSRLGIWGPNTQFPGFHDFIKAVERRGVGAMEIVAMDMKLRGMYIARQLSFAGVTFDIRTVALGEKFIEMYDSSVEMWVEAKRLFQEAADLMDYERKKLKTMWGQFWAAHQRFFKYLCIAAKVPEVVQLSKKGLADGKCVVIGLQSTGEARTLEQLEQCDGELSGFISTAKGVLESLIKRHFPTPSRVGMDWSLFDGDPTLPANCRKRKRSELRGPMFQDEEFSSDSDDSSSADGDSAVESSSDEEEGGEVMEEGEKREEESCDDSDSDSSSSDDRFSSFNPFGLIDESWERKPKLKRRRTERKGNFSIQPPPSSGGKGRGKTKTGFNSKSLKFEPVGSPKEGTRGLPDRRQSVALGEGIARSLTSPLSGPPPPSTPTLRQQLSFQPGSGEGSSLLNIMSSSAMSTGSNSSLRNITVKKMKEELLRKLEVLSPHLPPNTLDELIDGLGGPSRVAEMTGRRGRVVSLLDGTVQYQLRSESDVPLEELNMKEKQRFMDGEKNIAIISEAASSGISLQSDKRVKNHRRRLHITLELPWSADKAIQQFGRTHRSNQVNAPEYVFLISELAGEQRFASIVAKRLESLGALTHGDRRATESRDLSKYNVDTKHGRMALESVLKSVLSGRSALPNSGDYPEEFLDTTRTALIGVDLLMRGSTGLFALEKDSATLSRFLNRLLGLPVRLQNQLFAYFTDTLASLIKKAKRAGSWDGGIRDLGGSGEEVEVVEVQEYVGDPAYGTATTQLHKVLVERGLPFVDAVDLYNTESFPGEGFYISNKPRNDKHVAVLLKVVDPTSSHFAVHRPNTGRQSHSEKLKQLQKKYTKISSEEAGKWWDLQYQSSLSVCSHAFWCLRITFDLPCFMRIVHDRQGRCKQSVMGQQCEIGLRRRHYHILTGSVLGVWTHLEGVLARHSGHNNRMQITRVQSARRRLVGILIPSSCVSDLKQTLTRIAEQAAGLGTENTGTQPSTISL